MFKYILHISAEQQFNQWVVCVKNKVWCSVVYSHDTSDVALSFSRKKRMRMKRMKEKGRNRVRKTVGRFTA